MLFSVLGMTYSLFWGPRDISVTAYKQSLPFFLDVLFPFYMSPLHANVWYFICAVFLSIATWLFSTRVKITNRSFKRRLVVFILCAVSIVAHISLYASIYIYTIGYDPLIGVHENFESPYKEALHPASVNFVATVVLALPYIIVYMVALRIVGLYREDKIVQDWFKSYRFEHKWLGRLGDEKAGKLPDITLATRVDSNVPAVLNGDSRQLGVTLLGPPGSGKTSMKIIKAFRQDMGHMQRMINDFPYYAKKYGVGSEAFNRAMGDHLIGSIIIEPAKDLCDSAYDVALKHGIPPELICYLDPSNEDTPGFNCMIGPLSQVAETITAVLDGMSEVSNEFFRQACRTVLKMYIYLIKINRGNDCNLLDLDRMYQDPRFAWDMMLEVEKTIPSDASIYSMVKDQRLYWMLVKRVIRWFRNDALGLQVNRDNIMMRYPKGHEHEGKEMIQDLQSEFTRQTRNLLSDLIMNPFLARILINDTSVDIDRIMERGGVLLCNTDNGLLGDVSNAFGKLVLMSTQNAVFRRKGNENTRALVSLYVDEFYDYINLPWLKLAGQGRKYKIAPFVAYQTLSQLAVKFDDKFVDVTLGTTRNLIVYGGISNYDATMLTKYFGSKTIDEIAVRENVTPDAMESPNFGYSESVTREVVAVATEDDIMFNPFKFSYCRLVHEGSTQKAFLAEGDFIDNGEADEWEKGLDHDALEQYLNYYWGNFDTEHVQSATVLVEEDDEEENIIEVLDNDVQVLKKKETRFEQYASQEQAAEKNNNYLPAPVEAKRIRIEEESVDIVETKKHSVHDDKPAPEKNSSDNEALNEEPLSFSRNMSHFLKGSGVTVEPNYTEVKLEHSEKSKMDQLKHVSVDADDDAQAFVRALKAKSENQE